MSGESDSVSIVAVDTGGTFTDVVVARAGRLTALKLPSTPEDPARAVLDGVAGALGGDVADLLVHGSTVATNALLERRGGRVVLITNAGFEDVIEIGRQNRPQLYALVGTRPPALVPPEQRIGIAGRIGPRGEELEQLDERELARLAARIGDCDAIAICLLHSYANPQHERSVADAVVEMGVPLSISSELLPEYREYERTATTAVNAYVAPRMDRYLGRLQEATTVRRVRIMGSGGGALPVPRARREPVHTILSGPAGGVIGALAAARRAGFENVITFDMGGTSTDVSLCPGRPLHTREFTIAGLPVAVPVLDIHTVGAGGGSIAGLDAAGALRVGPESAGAVPGPIAYGRGGTELTVTDANVWLGRLPGAGWKHEVALDRTAIAEPLAALAHAMDTTAEVAAEGILAVIDTAMEGALRVISVERGYDPAEFTLVSFGGAAGLHAAILARRLGIPRVLVPPMPGVLSAFGMVVAPVRRAAARTVLRTGRTASDFDLASMFAELEAEAVEGLAAETGAVPECVRTVDARYRGQSYELSIPFSEDWVGAFHTAHRTRYGFDSADADVEAVTLRVEASAQGTLLHTQELPAATEPAQASSHGAVFAGGRTFDVAHYDRETLRAGHQLKGPCIVPEYSATTWVPDGSAARVLVDGSLVIE